LGAVEPVRTDLPGTTVGTVPGTVPRVVRTVVLDPVSGANLTAKSTASRSGAGGSNAMATWMVNCRAIGRTSAEAT